MHKIPLQKEFWIVAFDSTKESNGGWVVKPVFYKVHNMKGQTTANTFLWFAPIFVHEQETNL